MHEQALFDKDKRYFTLKFPLEDFAGFKTMNVIQVSKDNPWQTFFSQSVPIKLASLQAA